MTTTPWVMEAFNLYDFLKLKSVRSLIHGKVVHTSAQELQVQYGENSYLFVYRFGCFVFFNVPKEKIESELALVKSALGEGLTEPTAETYQITQGDSTSVEMEHVQLKKITRDHLRMIAMTLGQSSALEYFETIVEKMLSETSTFMRDLSMKGVVPFKTKNWLKIIGSVASTRQHIISNLSILDPPDETWKSKELESLYQGLQLNFDIDLRFRILDRKLLLVQENIEILADLTTHRRTVTLEVLVVLLIVFEILLAFTGLH